VDAAPIQDTARNLYVVPIRHHSPACAAHLQRLIEEVTPAAILVEGPCDFDPLIDLVCDARTRPPVAIVAMREGSHEGALRRVASYFPFCAHSPEYVALRSAADRGIQARFIDLPASAREMQWEVDEPDRSLLGSERAFDIGDYVTALARDLGCRDGNEVWDQLFETRLVESDWRSFFADVGQYCACIRAAADPAEMQRDGTLARETQMRSVVAAARAEIDGPIIVIVGGFHAPALFDDAAPVGKPRLGKAGKASGYLIRYGHRQLNALTGYAAGLPLPGFYERLWQARGGGLDDFALDLITGFAAHLRDSPAETPSFPQIANAVEQAERLAQLRGRPFPARDDIVDAVRSSFIKEEIVGADSPLLAELSAWLTGTAIGDVPPSAGSPPLVEAVREEARLHGFSIADGERRSRELDIYRRDKHRAISRFCHAMTLIDSGFARRTAGPDFRNEVDLDRLHEIWSVCWSPQVEARLIELCEVADTLAEALAAVLARQIDALSADGKGRNALAAIDLFATACRAGIGERAGPVLELIEAQVIEDPELRSVAAALTDLILLRRGRERLGIADGAPLDRLIGVVWRRVLLLLPDLADVGEEGVRDSIRALADLRGSIELARSSAAPIAIDLFDEALARLHGRPLQPMLAGAVLAFAMIDGAADAASLEARLRGELNSAYTDPQRRLAFLGGIIAIARELLWAVPAIVAALEETIATADDDDFIALLPHLRLALMPLDPREVDRLGEAVAERIGVRPDQIAARFSVSEGELLANLALDRDLAALLARDGVA
jgi:Family of unknown function (DUF5682)